MAMLVTGGARSGKSAFAEQLVARLGNEGIYLATGQIWDAEMADRIGKHQLDRRAAGFEWVTIEEPLEVAKQLDRLAESTAARTAGGMQPPVILLDCLTLWLTNWLMEAEQQKLEQPELNMIDYLAQHTAALAAAVARYRYPLVIVTNEVGDGIVPAYPLGRLFRDEAGRLNQLIAAICDRVFLVTAGIPVELKSQAFQWDSL